MQVSQQRALRTQTPACAKRLAFRPVCGKASLYSQRPCSSHTLDAHGLRVLSRQVKSATSRGSLRTVGAVSVKAEISYVMVKPDGVQRGLVGDTIGRFERKGFKLVGLKLYQTPRDIAEEHYKDLSSKPFYKALVEYILSGPVVAMVSCVQFMPMSAVCIQLAVCVAWTAVL